MWMSAVTHVSRNPMYRFLPGMIRSYVRFVHMCDSSICVIRVWHDSYPHTEIVVDRFCSLHICIATHIHMHCNLKSEEGASCGISVGVQIYKYIPYMQLYTNTHIVYTNVWICIICIFGCLGWNLCRCANIQIYPICAITYKYINIIHKCIHIYYLYIWVPRVESL